MGDSKVPPEGSEIRHWRAADGYLHAESPLGNVHNLGCHCEQVCSICYLIMGYQAKEQTIPITSRPSPLDPPPAWRGDTSGSIAESHAPPRQWREVVGSTRGRQSDADQVHRVDLPGIKSRVHKSGT